MAEQGVDVLMLSVGADLPYFCGYEAMPLERLTMLVVHRTGHGIGTEAHEDPYIVEGNEHPLEAGNVFSVEPGIYVPGRWGARLEDIVAASPAGPDPLNRADHRLAVVA